MKIKEQTRKLAAGCTWVRQGDVDAVWIWFSKSITLCRGEVKGAWKSKHLFDYSFSSVTNWLSSPLIKRADFWSEKFLASSIASLTATSWGVSNDVISKIPKRSKFFSTKVNRSTVQPDLRCWLILFIQLVFLSLNARNQSLEERQGFAHLHLHGHACRQSDKLFPYLCRIQGS